MQFSKVPQRFRVLFFLVVKGDNKTTSLSREIAAVRKLPGELTHRLDALAQLAAKTAEAANEDDTTIIPPGALNVSINLHDRIVLLFHANPDTEFTPLGVEDVFPHDNLNSIRSALIRLVAGRRIRRTGRGWYMSVNAT